MNRRDTARAILIVLGVASPLLLLPDALGAHGGELDEHGCHANRLHGGYHCHRGPFEGAMFDSRAEMLDVLAATVFETPHAFSADALQVTDGDLVTVVYQHRLTEIRLHGVDCPEPRQAFHRDAQQIASKLAMGTTVTVEVLGRDRYERLRGVLTLPDGRVMNVELVQAGLCWWDRTQAPEDGGLAKAEEEARGAKRGLWSEPDPIPPWEWRTMRKPYR